MAAALVAGAIARSMSMPTVREAPAPHDMIRWIADNSVFVDTVILPEKTPDTVRRLSLASPCPGMVYSVRLCNTVEAKNYLIIFQLSFFAVFLSATVSNSGSLLN